MQLFRGSGFGIFSRIGNGLLGKGAGSGTFSGVSSGPVTSIRRTGVIARFGTNPKLPAPLGAAPPTTVKLSGKTSTQPRRVIPRPIVRSIR